MIINVCITWDKTFVDTKSMMKNNGSYIITSYLLCTQNDKHPSTTILNQKILNQLNSMLRHVDRMLDTSNAHKTCQTGVRLHLRSLSDACTDHTVPRETVPRRTAVPPSRTTGTHSASLSLLHSRHITPRLELQL